MKLEIEANVACCDGCRKKLEKYLSLVKGVESVDLDSGKVVVTGNVDPRAVLHKVRKVKKKARILARGASSPAKNLSAKGDEHGRDSQDNNNKNNLAVAVVPAKEDKPSEKTIAVHKPSSGSNGRGEVASESKAYGV